MTNIRLLPVVILAIAALLVLKTLGLVTNGSYVLGVTAVQASGASSGGSAAGTTEADATVTPAGEPTLEDTSPTLTDGSPTLGEQPAEAGGHGAPAAEEAPAAEDHGAAAPAAEDHGAATTAEDHSSAPAEPPATLPSIASSTYCRESDATITPGGEVVLEGAAAEAASGGGHGAPAADATAETADHGESTETTAEEGHAEPAAAAPEGSFAAQMAIDCLPSGDVLPTEISTEGTIVPMTGAGGTSPTEQQLLERLTARRAELQQYESDLTLRASIVDAAEKRIEERTATLEALEAQISSLVDQRTEMESGQFAGIVAMYEAMKPKDAAAIFNNLDMEVLLRVAKTMSPRKMAPILAVMDTARAQELTVKMADLADKPATEMTPDDLAALPQIVGQ